MRRLFKAVDRLGNQAPLPAVRPDATAPVCRIGEDGEREIVPMRWGVAKARFGWVVNVRNLRGWPWREDMKDVTRRCLVPATSFAEYHPSEKMPPSRPGLKPRKAAAWFALKGLEERPPFAFAGLWKRFSGERRKGEMVEVDAFAILTTEANDVVAPVHKDAMPVILDPTSYDAWLSAPAAEAVKLQRPFPPDGMRLAFVGEPTDGA